MLKMPFGNNTMKKTAFYKWYIILSKVIIQLLVNQGQRPSFISTKEIETDKQLLVSDCRMIFRDIMIRTWYSFGTVFRIIHNELGMRSILARWIPHKKRPGMLQTTIFHHDSDNAPSHRAAPTTETMKRLGFERLDHPLTHQTWPIEIFFSISVDQECFERYAILGRC